MTKTRKTRRIISNDDGWIITGHTALTTPEAGILVVGCGAAFEPPPSGLREGLSEKGVVLEWMDTGAACRTFNVLLAEDRACAAALIAVD